MKVAFVLVLMLGVLRGETQQLVTRNGSIGFFSKTPLEDIKAENNQANAVLNIDKQELAVAVLMKGFLFQKALMQEHFNENYIESDKFPKATFTGTYSGPVDLNKSGTYPVTVKGQLTLHGETKPVEAPATFVVEKGKLTGKTTFALPPQDFNIKIPALVRDKIAKQITVSAILQFQLSD